MPLIFNHFPTNAILAMRVILLYSLLFPGIVFGQTANRSPKPPNIIFILADDLGYGDIGVFYQNERRQKDERHEPWFSTPHLDELANSGKMLISHYCGAPVCAPSRASLLLGLSQGQANVRNNQFDKALADQFTLGSLLQRAGYHTAAIGKWGLQGEGEGPDWPAHPLKRGFEYYLGYIRHRDGHEHYPKEGIYRGQKVVWENHTNLTAGLDKCYTGDLWTAAAKRYVSNQVHDGNDKPFFLYLAYDNPHAALELPTQAYPEGGGQSGGLQWLGRPGQMINTASGQPDSWIDPSFRSATWDDDADPSTPEQPWPDTYKRYATIVTRLDRQVGDLVSLLKDLHILENTLIVFTSDNGPSQESYLPKGTVPNEPDFFNSFGPFDGIKRDMWEGGARVPAIVAWRGHITAGRIDAPSAFYDWMATFANIAGYPAPAFTDGHSLWSLLSGVWTREDRTVYSEYYVGGRTPGYSDFDSSHRNRLRRQMQLYRWNDTVAVRYDIQSPGGDFEVYAIDQDPQQKRNLAANNRLPGLQKFLKAEVVRRHRPDSSAIRPYDTAFLEPVSPEGQIQAGWSFIFVGNDCPWLASLPDAVALHKLKVPGLEAPGLHTGDSGMLYWEGYIQAPATGDYLFYLNTAAPTVVKVYNLDLFNAEFQYGGKKPLASSLRLRKGLHPIRVYCRLYAGKMHSVPVLRWSGPGFSGIKEFSAVHSTRADK